jgi:hypothetical protein
MSGSMGSLRPFVTVNRSAQLYNTVSYPSGGNIGSANNATFVGIWASGVTVINAAYVISGQILPGMTISGIGLAAGTYIVGPLSQNGTGVGGLGQYVISVATTGASSAVTVTSGTYNAAGSYSLNSLNVFLEDKYFAPMPLSLYDESVNQGGGGGGYNWVRLSDSIVIISVLGAGDNQLNNTPIEIRVYN